MKHLTHVLLASMLLICMNACHQLKAASDDFFYPHTQQGVAATQPTTQPLVSSPAANAGAAMQTVAAYTPFPWNALLNVVGSALALVATQKAKQVAKGTLNGAAPPE